MGYKTFVSMNIAIVGSGPIAEKYAVAFAFAGHIVFLASKEGSNSYTHPLLDRLDNVSFCSIADAAYSADLIIVATTPKDVREVAYWLGDVRQKVIIDFTSNVPAPDEALVKTICGLKSITGSPHIVKAFNAKGYEQLLAPLFPHGSIDLMLVGDSKKAKEVTKILAADLGMGYFYDFGGNEAILLFNEMTTCWRNMLLRQSASALEVVSARH